MIIQVMVLAVQNAVDHRDLGTATATESFSRSMGGAFGVAVSGAILTNRLLHNLALLVPARSLGRAHVDVGQLTGSPQAIHRLPPAIQRGVIESLSRSIHVVFLVAVPLALAAFGVTFLLRETPLRETAHVGLEVVPPDPLVPAGDEEVLPRA